MLGEKRPPNTFVKIAVLAIGDERFTPRDSVVIVAEPQSGYVVPTGF